MGLVGGNSISMRPGNSSRRVARSLAVAAAQPVAATKSVAAAQPRSLYAGFGRKRRVRPNGFHATFKNDLKIRQCN